jgi:hypothetical protein
MYLKNDYNLQKLNLQCKKKCSKIHLYGKVIFGQKDIKSFLKIMPLVHLISFAPKENTKK